MKEIIKDIVEFENDSTEGYIITTDKQKITISIDNVQDCCEVWGMITSEEDTGLFINSELLGISEVDEAYNEIVKSEFSADYEGGAIFVNLSTSIGVLQFAIYNFHNGYYGHRVKVTSEQLKIDEVI